MRFNSFFAEYERTTLNGFLKTNKVRNKEEKFSKSDVLSVSGELGVINQIEHLGRSYAGESVALYHILRTGQIVYTKSPLAESPYGIIKLNRNEDGIVSTLYAVYDVLNKADCRYIEHYFAYKPRLNNYLRPIVRIGAKHDMKIGNDEVLKNYVNFPSKEEQQKISDFLDLINQRIDTQNKIIEKCKSLINQIRHVIELKYSEAQKTSLFELCSIKTGKKDANKSSQNGKYPFFTCGRETLSIDTYSFEGKALLVSGNGEIGQVKYYDGKFDAYQRTYVLQNFSIKPKYIKIWLEILLPKIIEKEKNVGAMPYIVVSTLANIKIPKFDTKYEDNLISLFQAFENKVQDCEITLKLYRKQKDFFLCNLFI